MLNLNCITDDMMPALQGVIPAVIASASAQGVPNVTYISQVFYIDKEHVALSRQFFNKTIRNISENPFTCVVLTCPVTYNMYKIQLQFKESLTEGETFTSMRLQLEVIAGIQGKADTFKLQAADVYKVIAIERVYTINA
ncbi:MAG: pyridoxamine 5'-phosphate oxidase family protein [Chitinophagaceae bacterium]